MLDAGHEYNRSPEPLQFPARFLGRYLSTGMQDSPESSYTLSSKSSLYPLNLSGFLTPLMCPIFGRSTVDSQLLLGRASSISTRTSIALGYSAGPNWLNIATSAASRP